MWYRVLYWVPWRYRSFSLQYRRKIFNIAFDIRTPFLQFYDIGLQYRIRYRRLLLRCRRIVLRYRLPTGGRSKNTLLAILRYWRSKLRYRKKAYNIVYDIDTRYEDAPNPFFLPPDIKLDIVGKEPISKEKCLQYLYIRMLINDIGYYHTTSGTIVLRCCMLYCHNIGI